MPRRLAALDDTLGSLQFLCRAAGYSNVGKLPASALAVLRQSAIVTVPWNQVFRGFKQFFRSWIAVRKRFAMARRRANLDGVISES